MRRLLLLLTLTACGSAEPMAQEPQDVIVDASDASYGLGAPCNVHDPNPATAGCRYPSADCLPFWSDGGDSGPYGVCSMWCSTEAGYGDCAEAGGHCEEFYGNVYKECVR